MSKLSFKKGDFIVRIYSEHMGMKIGNIAKIIKINGTLSCKLDRYEGSHVFVNLKKAPMCDTPLWKLLNE